MRRIATRLSRPNGIVITLMTVALPIPSNESLVFQNRNQAFQYLVDNVWGCALDDTSFSCFPVERLDLVRVNVAIRSQARTRKRYQKAGLAGHSSHTARNRTHQGELETLVEGFW